MTSNLPTKVEPRPLHGERIVIAGRLSSMTREQAATAIDAAGGRVERAFTEQTTMVVVGDSGVALEDDGRMAGAVQRARRRQRAGAAVAIVTEPELLHRLGRRGLEGLYSQGQLSRMLGVPARELRSWLRAGLIRPRKVLRRLEYFDFHDVATARELQRLTRGGASPGRIRRSLQQLRPWLPDAERAMSQLETLENGGALRVRLDDGRLAEPTGQLCFDFERPPAAATMPQLARRRQRSADEWFEIGIAAETEQRFEDAIEAYHHALAVGGPEPEIAFNFGNALYEMGRVAEAVQRYLQAVELEPGHAGAWNNLGNAQADLGRLPPALAAYRRALHVDPSYADAHFNLATALDQAGDHDAARPHWQAYRRLGGREP